LGGSKGKRVSPQAAPFPFGAAQTTPGPQGRAGAGSEGHFWPSPRRQRRCPSRASDPLCSPKSGKAGFRRHSRGVDLEANASVGIAHAHQHRLPSARSFSAPTPQTSPRPETPQDPHSGVQPAPNTPKTQPLPQPIYRSGPPHHNPSHGAARFCTPIVRISADKGAHLYPQFVGELCC